MTSERGGEVALSIVIPAFNEEQRLPGSVVEVTRFLDQHQRTAEVLVVENGSHDQTARIADETERRDARFRALHVTQAGKGRAVRHGVLASRGEVVVFCDADFSMPVEEVRDLCSSIESGADIAIASREAPGSRRIGEPWRRHFMGRVFNWLVRVLALPGLSDSQCGFKAFRREVAMDLFRRQVIDGWAFDVEVLFIARRRGYSVKEVPITWRYDPSSRVRPVRDTLSMLGELIRLRLNAARGRYD